ncbi:MAG: hypothetical protein M3457_23435 [Chloroflexota bacterium]|nr:hypothetical protein [Chloroflexota bacterium]
MTRQQAPVISGIVAAIASFVVWLIMDNSLTSSIIFAVIVGLLAYGVSWFQNRNRT